MHAGIETAHLVKKLQLLISASSCQKAARDCQAIFVMPQTTFLAQVDGGRTRRICGSVSLHIAIVIVKV